MTIEKARNGDIEIAYECFGPPDGIPLVLSAGSGGQMLMWHEDFCHALGEHGFRVVRYDHRDMGLSTHLSRYDGIRPRVSSPFYTLRDLAGDLVAVCDAMGWERAHIGGASLGATVAQTVGAHHASRVRSLILFSTQPTWPLANRLNLVTLFRMFRIGRRKTPDRESEGQRMVDFFRLMGSPGFALDEDHWRECGRISFDRGRNPEGEARQAVAIFAARDRRPDLAVIDTPALLIHGEADPVSPLRAGRDTARALRDARLVSYPGMGHDLPRELWPSIIGEIVTHTTAADQAVPR